jgi:hypothetical protein
MRRISVATYRAAGFGVAFGVGADMFGRAAGATPIRGTRGAIVGAGIGGFPATGTIAGFGVAGFMCVGTIFGFSSSLRVGTGAGVAGAGFTGGGTGAACFCSACP